MKITIVAVAIVPDSVGVDALNDWVADALTTRISEPTFVAVSKGVSRVAIDAGADPHDAHSCAFCVTPLPASVHIPHSTAELPDEPR